jgi:hypothetical protein
MTTLRIQDKNQRRSFRLQAVLGMMLIATILLSAAYLNAADKKNRRSKPTRPIREFPGATSDPLVSYINEQIRAGWKDNEVTPSDRADDAEWLRRVYLDIVGHIPPLEILESFLADKDKDTTKRAKMIDRLLDDPNYVRNWTTIWTNLSIGRQTPRRVSRVGMQKFFREAFARNRPWNDIVYDLVTAEGRFDENGAVNYLLAQMTMRDEAVQATAKTTRLFLGIQVQCTQCHNHPFNDWKQNQFWEFNSFFRQARRVNHRKYDPKSGRQIDDFSELVKTGFSGPVYFEKRNAVMEVAYPKFFGEDITENDETDRRVKLAELMTRGNQPYIATAMVNRMWGHFFGYGFTRPVDDMGPHNPASHPEILEKLAEEFIEADYDQKKLIRWICNSEAYNLTSRFNKKNTSDNPAAGEVPLFSHMYVKSLEAEQLYDSLIIATNAHKSGRSSWSEAEQKRQEWMRQFVITFDTDENDETTTFDGTIPQALMMMNGDLVKNAISVKNGSYLHSLLSDKSPDARKVQKLFLTTLGRKPSRVELSASNKLIRGNRNKIAAFQNLFWALLNSNEFIFNH